MYRTLRLYSQTSKPSSRTRLAPSFTKNATRPPPPHKQDRIKPHKNPIDIDPPDSDFHQPSSSQKQNYIKKFTSPPLLPGFLPALDMMLGPNAKPTPIQSLSIQRLLDAEATEEQKELVMLASETGSGKSLAYLLPLLQRLKISESENVIRDDTKGKKRPLNPRAIILAPTHELARQLSAFAKSLTKDVKLRVMCLSQANLPSRHKVMDVTARKLSEALADDELGEMVVEEKKRSKFPVDVLVGTPVKVMEFVRGRGWDRLQGELEPDEDGKLPRLRRGRDQMPGFGRWKKEPELGLGNVEWVVVDEADVLFDPDFQQITRTLLADISSARGAPVELSPSVPLSSFTTTTSTDAPTSPITYPFNLILTTATIPKNLNTYLSTHHPTLTHLASPRLHHLPRTLKTEYASWTGGHKFADIEHRIRKVWSDDASVAAISAEGPPRLSKILVFCNQSTRVHQLAEYLEEKQIKSVALTSTSEQRRWGSNRHLDGFLRPIKPSQEVNIDEPQDPKETPHVLITTSLLSRGLDFRPELEHVFIVDEPRNMVDFLHRAGRSGRAGQKGMVVIFTKMKGRGSSRSREVRQRVGEVI